MNKISLWKFALPTAAVLLVGGTAWAEVQMKYPFLEGVTNTADIFAPHWGVTPAADIDTNGYPTVHAPISGTVVLAVHDKLDNKLTGNQLTAKYNQSCTPFAWAYGNTIIIEAADGSRVRLGHLHQNSLMVGMGASVVAGQPIAEAGSSGYVCAGANAIGDHIHVEFTDEYGVKHQPGSRLCDPILFPPDDVGACDVGDGPMEGDDVCGDGVCGGSESCEICPVDCGECPPQSMCPSGDGLYCGESVGLNAGTLYSCTAGEYSVQEVCPDGCEIMPPGQNDHCANSPCDCDSGSCCDSCYYRPPSYACEVDADVDYACLGNGCGSDVSVSTRDRLCSGSSAACDGGYSSWSVPSVYDSCTDEESCSPGDTSCNPDQMCVGGCTDSFSITQYQCQTFSSANGAGPGGGEIMEVCASTNAQNGYMTVKAVKYDGSNFGNRPYQVRVSDAQGDPCGPATWFFVISNSNPVGIGTSQLTFSFPSQWLPDQWEKAYCVTASTQLGDPGYDGNNPQQQSWWYSDKAVLTRQCN